MLKTEDLSRSRFFFTELNIKPPLPIKYITAPKELADCLYIAQQNIIRKTQKLGCLKSQISSLSRTDLYRTEVQISSIERDIKQLTIYSTTALNHLTINNKTTIQALYSLPSNPDLFNVAKVIYGGHEFFIQLSQHYLKGKKIPKSGIMPTIEPDAKYMAYLHDSGLFESEATQVLESYHNTYINKRAHTRIRNQKITEHNLVVKKIRKLLFGGQVEILNHAA